MDRDEPLWLVFEASSLNYTNDSNAGRDKALSAIASKRDPVLRFQLYPS